VAGLVCATATARTQDGLVVTHGDRQVQPGDVVPIVVQAPKDVSGVTAVWQTREVAFVRDSDGVWRGLIGIDVGDDPGPRTLTVTATRGAGGALGIAHAFTVEPKAFRTRRISVAPRFVNPPKSALPRIQRETRLLNALFKTSSPDRLWTRDAVRPVEGVAVSGFGVRSVLNGENRGPHNGLDLAATTGTPIHAPTPGVVVYAREFYYSGNTVILDHGQGLFSTMAHLSVIDVKEGQRVARGDLLGKVGATGRVTGPHLHWAVRVLGARVDPLSLLDVLDAAPAAGR
jgi:murein DD-endopeptidase MepM/ murein hydrolase activator NlpD